MFYRLRLLFISILTLYFIVNKGIISPLSALILVIVYVGAMMILVGYICAVTPNLYIEPDYKYLSLGFIASVTSVFLFSSNTHYFSKITNLVDYFYSEKGVLLFFFLVLILFITLLIVTTHDNSPRGPFRSLV